MCVCVCDPVCVQWCVRKSKNERMYAGLCDTSTAETCLAISCLKFCYLKSNGIVELEMWFSFVFGKHFVMRVYLYSF